MPISFLTPSDKELNFVCVVAGRDEKVLFSFRQNLLGSVVGALLLVGRPIPHPSLLQAALGGPGRASLGLEGKEDSTLLNACTQPVSHF